MAKAPVRERLAHVLDAIDTILQFTGGRTLADYERDRMLRDAIERNIERLSEASRHIPDAYKQLQPEIDWRRIADIGNVLRHAYDQVAGHRVWDIVAEDLRPLRVAIESIVAAIEKAENG